MAVIHGASHKVIRFFREKPAALAVYWIYCSRQNKDGVAWAGQRGLAQSTGWDRKTCGDGRAFLVEHKALEVVTGYVRPEWRKLPAKDLKRRLALDKTEYFRPTGVFVMDGTEYPMLYIPASEDAADLEQSDAPGDDGLPHRPSSASTIDGFDHRPDTPELDSFNALDSSSELDSSSDSLRAREQFKVYIPTELQLKVDVLTFPAKVNAIFYAYIDALALPQINRKPAALASALWEQHREAALGLAVAGITPAQVTEYVLHEYTAPGKNFWNDIDNPLPLRNVSKSIAGYLQRKTKQAAKKDTPSKPAGTVVPPSPFAKLTTEQQAAYETELAALPEEPIVEYLPDNPNRAELWRTIGRTGTAAARAKKLVSNEASKS